MKFLKIYIQVFLIFSTQVVNARDVTLIQKTKVTDSVRIGLLISDSKSMAARHGAEIAILKANRKGGFKGRPFQLVVRSMEGPWGTGSEKTVSLIFDEKVCAIVGSNDGRNAHLVEQVATKSHIVYLSAWASDPTLSQAFIPWFFNCVPNDLQQADALVGEIYYKRKFSKIAICSDSSYDSRLALKSIIEKTKAAGKSDPLVLYFKNTDQSMKELTDRLKKKSADCIILSGQPAESLRVIRHIRFEKVELPVYGLLALLDENKLSGQDIMNYQNVVFVTSGNWLKTEAVTFREEYKRIYGNFPGEVAAYSYDSMNLIIEAIKATGPDHENIQKSLRKISFKGVTGSIQFDDKGNRKGEANLMEIRNGILVPAAN
jgi:branched-chain amino acid transport system substrate-binding protein